MAKKLSKVASFRKGRRETDSNGDAGSVEEVGGVELAAVPTGAASGERDATSGASPGFQGRIADLEFQSPNPIHMSRNSQNPIETGVVDGVVEDAPRPRSKSRRRQEILQHAVESRADKGRGVVEERTQSVEM